MAGEYRHSTSVPTFLVTPRRREVVIAKLVTATAVGAVLGALAFGAALATAIPALGWHGVHHLAGDTAQMWLGAALATGLFGALGVAVGALTRSTVIAIVGTIVWVQFVEEALLASALPAVGKWLPTGANIAITRTATHPARLLAPGLATVVLLAWAAVITGTAGRFVVRRDV
jgi:hypothetical protein